MGDRRLTEGACHHAQSHESEGNTMTMAKVENGSVTEVGLPVNLRSFNRAQLKQMGWHKVVGTDKPTQATDPGYRWEYGATWSASEGKVYGTWQAKQRPQPYPSWAWVDGQGWVAPVAKPDDGKDYYWDESAQAWVEDDLG
jgi:hypothetical protein